jgi:hypothetical protein
MSGFANRPKVLKGAFVEYGLSVPPLAVVFQFNPVQLQRSRSLSFRAPNEVFYLPTPDGDTRGEGGERTRLEKPRDLREWHAESDDLADIRKQQIVSVQEETLSFELRLDATDALDDGEKIAQAFGIAPALSTLELMTYPKGGGLLSEGLGMLLGKRKGHQFASPENPPMVLFIWGIQRVLPVNINSLVITETDFDVALNPVRATDAVSVTVVEGKNPVAKFSSAAKEAMSVLNLAKVVTEIEIPG